MAMMPSDLARRGELFTTASPLRMISPESGWTAPVMILMSVDLPAPFSPMSACTSPARSSMEPLFKACTPAYDLVMSAARSSTLSVMSLALDDDDVQLARPVHPDGERQLDVGSARRAGDESHRPAQPVAPPLAEQPEHLGQRLPHASGADDGDVDGRHQRGEAVPLAFGFEHERAGLGHGPLRARHAEVAVEEVCRRRVLDQLRPRVHAREHA